MDAEFEVCVECGNLHVEGSPGPRNVDRCAVCGAGITDVGLDDLVGL